MSDVGVLQEFGRGDVAVAGGKGANLGELARAGFPVPPGFVVTTRAYADVVASQGLAGPIAALAGSGPSAAAEIRALFDRVQLPDRLRDEIGAAYRALGSPAVAVRSSATAEDLPTASFAGQQDTYLDVRGQDEVLDAVRRCWASLWTDRAVSYRAQQGVAADDVSLAVVVQEMVPADAAGVLFTANPLTGRRDESVVSAARGLGEAVVSDTTETDQLVLDLGQHRVVERHTVAEPVLSDDEGFALATLGARIAEHFGAPQDIEWARHDGHLYVVQARPITALPPAEAEPPTDWSVPDPRALYVRGSIIEQLPDPLTPLFADLVEDAVVASLTALMTELVGAGAVRPGDLSLPTVNGYAYYAYTRSGMLRVTLRTARALPVLGRGRRSGRERWRRYSRPRYADAVAAWAGRDLAELPAADLLAGVETLLHAGAEYYTAVQTLIPVAAMSEVAFSRFYLLAVRRPGDPPPATFLLGFDSVPIRAEKSLYDVATWLRSRPDLAAVVRDSPVERLLAERDAPTPVTAELWRRLEEHLDAYGHMTYNLDFANPVPADDPAPLLETLQFYLRQDVAGPYERQRRSAAARDQAAEAVRRRLDPVRRQAFDRLLRWAQEAAPVREDALAEVGLAWPQLRRLLAELGRRAADAGVVDGPGDVFWLRRHELASALVDGEAVDRRDDVEQRRREWRARRRVRPPQLLPESGWGRVLGRFMPATEADQTGDVLTGLAGSAGRVTAVARVLAGPEDFTSLQPGEVLVAAITTPAWTSLFVRAAGVVTDIGGPLSHSSIVAREYGIPAVLGTAVATRRIRSGQRVTVDGAAGTVTLLADEQAATAAPPPVSGS